MFVAGGGRVFICSFSSFSIGDHFEEVQAIFRTNLCIKLSIVS